MKIKKYIILVFILMSFPLYSSESMRNCILLPVIDGLDNKLGFKVFEEIETYIKEGSWCTYKSNSEPPKSGSLHQNQDFINYSKRIEQLNK